MSYEGKEQETQFQKLETLRAAFKMAKEAAESVPVGSKERVEHLRYVESLGQDIAKLKYQLGLTSPEEWAGPETEDREK